MSVVSWITPRGNLGTVPENTYYSYQLNATDSDAQPLFYSFISGQLPGGLYVTVTGELRGIPTILSSINQTAVYTFTVRATNPNGTVADRSFSMGVSNINGPQITPKPDMIGAWFDGNFLDYSFGAVNDNPNAVQTWAIISGDIPPGTTFTAEGRLYGYVDLVASNVTELGFEAAPVESVVFDALPVSADKYYNFTVQVSDNLKVDTVNVRLLIVSKGNYSADNAVTLTNNTFIKIDADNNYRPIILNNPDSLPVQISGGTFAYKFLAYDPEDQVVVWTIDELATSGMDEIDAAVQQNLIGNGTSGPYSLIQSPSVASRIVVQINGVLQTAFTDYVTAGTNLTFTSAVPTTADIINVQFISITTGFDSLLFDQGSVGLPAGLIINTATGWVFGTLPAQIDDIVTYSFTVIAKRKADLSQISDPVTFNLTAKRDIDEEIIWNTPTELGSIDNGAVSELFVSAVNTLGKELEYSIIYRPSRRTPQGLKFLPSGRFIGRTSFRYFSLDGSIALLNLTSAEELEVGMTIQGVGVASGCKITALIDSNTIEVRPAIYVTQGTVLTFSSISFSKSVSTTSNAVSTAIDRGKTTFDQQCGFTVKAEAIDGSIAATKSFSVRVNPRNLAPYENVYLKALPKPSERKSLNDILDNQTIFSKSLLYRPDDPYFGIQKDLKLLFLSGLAAATAENFVSSIERNHYFKSINFGEVKTARSLDSNGNVSYEVVYVTLVDTQAYKTAGPPVEIPLGGSNDFLYRTQSYNAIYPNSFNNMQKRLENGIGYTNQSTLPKWMTSPQDDGTILGLTRAIVLAYTQPGASKLVAYRLQNNSFDINNISFVADRYQRDNYLSQFYNLITNTFETSELTSFDKYVDISAGADLIETAIIGSVTNSNTIILSDSIAVGYGWRINSVDTNSTVPNNTVISNIVGNAVTLSNSVTADNGAKIKINGKANVDYAVSAPFNRINGESLSTVISNFLIDGIINFLQGDQLIFARQAGYGGIADGWVRTDGSIVPGYLEKLGGQATINERGGVWSLSWTEFPVLGFDDDSTGFDQNSAGITLSHFDQGNDAEISLTLVQEVILDQTVTVRTGETYTQSTLQYLTEAGESVPRYVPFSINSGINRTAETTFDGGSCLLRAGYTGSNAVSGGTTFSSNQDIFIVPGTLDKYIKFPQIGVFV
jgi:hypothetical protein